MDIETDNNINSANVGVVIVTYGERRRFLEAVLGACAAERRIAFVVVVNNGSRNDIEGAGKQILGGRMRVVAMSRNEGSAGGYRAGIEAALADRKAEYLWLLDDDTNPAPGAFDELWRRYRTLAGAVGPGNLIALPLRANRKRYLRVAEGESVARWFPRADSFLGFHFLWTPFGKIADRLRPPRGAGSGEMLDHVRVPVAPWAGMFFHRSLIEKFGYPETGFFLYGDDTEYSLRIGLRGGVLYLVPASRLVDLEESWHTGEKMSSAAILRNYADSAAFRIYYAARNGAFISKRYYRRRRFIYGLNKLLFMAIIRVYLFARRRADRGRLIERAIRDGEAGLLGERVELR